MKLGDFGLATKIYSERSLMATTFVGTLTHEAPEILQMQPYGYKVDIWSLGVMLFSMLFYNFPFGINRDYKVQLKKIESICVPKFDFTKSIENIPNPQKISPELIDLF
jgi:serine/threonine protein kinase